MDYSFHYTRLIERGRHRSSTGIYMERHHVIPRCMGGSNELSNLVLLTPEEHYVAHQLLVRMYPDVPGLAFAASAMCIRPNNKLYGWVRRRISENMKSNNPNAGGVARKEYVRKHGRHPPQRPWKHSEEGKRRLSESKSGGLNPNKDGSARRTKTVIVCELTGRRQEFDSLKEAEATVGANHASVHNNRKRQMAYKGYFWYVGKEIKEAP